MSADERTQRVVREIFMRSVAITKLTARTTRALADLVRNAYFPAGTAIYRKGEAASTIFFIERGVATLGGDSAPPTVFRDRSVIGILDVIQDRPRARTAMATTDVYALCIGGEEYFEVLEDSFEDARATLVSQAGLMHALAHSLPPDGGFLEPRAAPAGEVRPKSLVDRMTLMRGAPSLAKAPIQSLASLASLAEDVTLAPGERLLQVGAPRKELHLVSSGIVDASCEEAGTRARFGRGALVCGFGAISGDDRGYEAHAAGEASVLRLRHEDLFDVMEEHFALMRSMLAMMAGERERLVAEQARRKERAGTAMVTPGRNGATRVDTGGT